MVINDKEKTIKRVTKEKEVLEKSDSIYFTTTNSVRVHGYSSIQKKFTPIVFRIQFLIINLIPQYT